MAFGLYHESHFFEALLQCTKARDLEKKLYVEKNKQKELKMLFGCTYIQLKMFEKAVDSFERCLDLCENSSDYFECYNHIGYALYKINNYKEAKSYWDKALASPVLDRFSYLRILNRYCFMEITLKNIEAATIRLKQSKLVLDSYKEHYPKEFNVELGLYKRNEAMFLIINNELQSAINTLMESIDLLENTPRQVNYVLARGYLCTWQT